MATFSDLMNLLLCFFVLLYSMSTIDEEKYDAIRASLSMGVGIFQGDKTILNENGIISADITQIEEDSNVSDALQEVVESKKEHVSDMYDEISEMFEDKNISSNIVDISIDPEYNFVKFTIEGSILFHSGSATLRNEAMPVLSKLGDILKVYDQYLIEVEGHTDNVPITLNKEYDNNMWLSTARALNTATYLVDEKGINPSTIKSSGRGEHEPIASNETSIGRGKNRRVEIKIYHQLSSY